MQIERMALLEKAIAARGADPLVVEQCDAAAWIERELAAFPPPAEAEPVVTFVFHSLFYQYPPQEVRERIAQAISSAGALCSFLFLCLSKDTYFISSLSLLHPPLLHSSHAFLIFVSLASVILSSPLVFFFLVNWLIGVMATARHPLVWCVHAFSTSAC